MHIREVKVMDAFLRPAVCLFLFGLLNPWESAQHCTSIFGKQTIGVPFNEESQIAATTGLWGFQNAASPNSISALVASYEQLEETLFRCAVEVPAPQKRDVFAEFEALAGIQAGSSSNLLIFEKNIMLSNLHLRWEQLHRTFCRCGL